MSSQTGARPTRSANDLVELDEMPARPAHGTCCATCPHFDSPNAANRAKVESVGGTFRGDCNLQPVPVKKRPEDICGQHPELLIATQSKVLAAAFEPFVEKLAAALHGGKA